MPSMRIRQTSMLGLENAEILAQNIYDSHDSKDPSEKDAFIA